MVTKNFISILWLVIAIVVVYSLFKMFSSEIWWVYALVVGVGFYFLQKIFWNYSKK